MAPMLALLVMAFATIACHGLISTHVALLLALLAVARGGSHLQSVP